MLRQTYEDQRRALYWHRRRQQMVTPRRLLRESDELMYWVEECLVQRLRIVPGWLYPRLVHVLQHADPRLPIELARERRPARVLDLLYRAQASLMRQAVTGRRPAKVIPLFR